jgi:hypothetical protein
MAQLEIVPVTGRSDLNEFIDLPWKIYADYPNWVPPLKAKVRYLLDPNRHPFWKFGDRALYLARRGKETVGRIAAIVNAKHNEYHHERMGVWGFFEAQNDQEAASALFSAAEHWVRDKGMTFLRGPMNPSTNYEVGTLIEGFQYPPTIMMTYNPPYYADLIESAGFCKEKDLFALIIEQSSQSSARVERLARRIVRNNHITIRTANPNDIESEVKLINEIYHECWCDNWGFVPMTEEESKQMAKDLARIADPDLIFFPYYHDEPAGVALVLPDINPLLKRLNGRIGLTGLLKIALYKREIKGLRGVLFGIRKAYQKLGLPLVAFDYMNRTGRSKNYQYMELGWNLEDNHAINQFDREVGGRIIKRYRIYRKEISE